MFLTTVKSCRSDDGVVGWVGCPPAGRLPDSSHHHKINGHKWKELCQEWYLKSICTILQYIRLIWNLIVSESDSQVSLSLFITVLWCRCLKLAPFLLWQLFLQITFTKGWMWNLQSPKQKFGHLYNDNHQRPLLNRKIQESKQTTTTKKTKTIHDSVSRCP